MSKVVKIILIIISCLLVLGVLTGCYIILNNPNIYNGVKIEGLDVGSHGKNEAVMYLKDVFNQDAKDKEFLFTYSKYSKSLKYKELGIEYNYDKAVQEAYEVGRAGNIFARLVDIAKVSFEDKNIDLEYKTNDEKLKMELEQIDKEISVDKKDATITYSNGEFITTDEVIGLSVDLEALKKDVESSISEFDVIELPIKKDNPRVVREELNKIKEEIGTYSTSFKANDSNRSYNVKRASDSIDKKLLLPGETFSFNETTGPRSLKAGYKEATVIYDGKFVPGEGGGVCQVSSTLYNTLLSSQVNIVERHRHSLPVGYVPPGRDATVAYDVLDLKFKNNYSAPIYIQSYVNGNVLTVKMYGNKSMKS